MGLELWTYTTANVGSLGVFEYAEAKETGKMTFATGSSTANRVFYVAWDSFPNFLDSLLGWSRTAGGNVIRILPDEHPDLNGFWAVDVCRT